MHDNQFETKNLIDILLQIPVKHLLQQIMGHNFFFYYESFKATNMLFTKSYLFDGLYIPEIFIEITEDL